MAEEKAAPVVKAPEQKQAPQENLDTPEPKVEPEAPKYTQAEMDRITTKVRKNAARDAELRFRREQGSRQEPPPEKPAPPTEEVEPQRDKFETFEDHQRAVAAFEGRKAAREERKKEKDEDAQRTVAERQQQAKQAWEGKIQKAIDKLADFEEKLEDSEPTLAVIHAAPMRAFITESDIGPEIIYHLCDKPEEAKRIAALPAYRQAAEIAKIEDALLAAGKPKEEPKGEDELDDDETPEAKEARERRSDGTFKAKKEPPPPIEPGAGRPANNSSLPSDRDDPDTWRRKELARMRKVAGK